MAYVRKSPRPQGQNVQVNVYALLTPISVLIWVFVRTEQTENFGGRLIIVLRKFDGRWGSPPS